MSAILILATKVQKFTMYPLEVPEICNSGISTPSVDKPNEKVNTCMSSAMFEDNITFILLF
jgi:hypothetical protein